METQKESFGYQKFKQYKKEIEKRLLKTSIIIYVCFVLVLAVCSFLMLSVKLGLIFVLGGSIVCILTLLIANLLIVKHIPHKEVNLNNLQVFAFVERPFDYGNVSVTMHLIINEKEYAKNVAIKNYGPYVPGGLVLDMIELISFYKEYSKDKEQDTKKGLQVAYLEKRVDNNDIAAVFDKYSRQLTIVINSKCY